MRRRKIKSIQIEYQFVTDKYGQQKLNDAYSILFDEIMEQVIKNSTIKSNG